MADGILFSVGVYLVVTACRGQRHDLTGRLRATNPSACRPGASSTGHLRRDLESHPAATAPGSFLHNPTGSSRAEGWWMQHRRARGRRRGRCTSCRRRLPSAPHRGAERSVGRNAAAVWAGGRSGRVARATELDEGGSTAPAFHTRPIPSNPVLDTIAGCVDLRQLDGVAITPMLNMSSEAGIAPRGTFEIRCSMAWAVLLGHLAPLSRQAVDGVTD